MNDRSSEPVKLLTYRYLALAGWTGLFLGYFLLFRFFAFSGSLEALQRALFNTLPAAILSWPVIIIIERYLIDGSFARKVISHIFIGLAFAMLWYIGIQVSYGLQHGWVETGITGRPLSGAALSWQLFQGVTLYGVVALYAYATHFHSRLTSLERDLERLDEKKEKAGPALSSKQQILVKDGRRLFPVSTDDILLLSGAGDYTEVVTTDRTYLSVTPLGGFEDELASDRFLRVHRSHLVNLDAVLEIESGGNGRLILHLRGGRSVTTSRAGAKDVRERAL